jgi:hypothetical protein
MAEFGKEEFKRKYPNLASELEQGAGRVQIDSLQKSDKFQGYMPTPIDYLRRCDTEEQAIQTIEYLEGRKEITHEYAEELRKQLKEKGVRSFGPKKDEDYYLKQAGY